MSTISFLTWEQEYINLLATPQNKNFINELESKRISEFLFSEYPNNFFVRLMTAFDAGVALCYEKDIRRFLHLTCPKFKGMSYKVEYNNPASSFQADGSTYQEHISFRTRAIDQPGGQRYGESQISGARVHDQAHGQLLLKTSDLRFYRKVEGSIKA